MDAIRRGRRQQLRAATGLLAVVAAGGLTAACAVATPSAPGARSSSSDQRQTNSPVPAQAVTSQRPGGASPASRIVTPEPVASAGPARAAAGTALSGCAAQASQGGLGRDWQASPATTHAGPLSFVGGGHSSGRLRLYVAVVVLSALRPGSVVVVRVAPAGRTGLRFLYGPADSLSPGTRYTMASGEPGVTFVACPGASLTDYYGGFLVNGARCVPVLAWVTGRARPIAFRLGACTGH